MAVDDWGDDDKPVKASPPPKDTSTPKLDRQWTHVQKSMVDRGYSLARASQVADVVTRKSQIKRSRLPRTRPRK